MSPVIGAGAGDGSRCFVGAGVLASGFIASSPMGFIGFMLPIPGFIPFRIPIPGFMPGFTREFHRYVRVA